MTTIWALISNSGFAQIYEIKAGGKDIKEVYNIENPDGRLKNGQILTDKPGRGFDSMGKSIGKGSAHAYETMWDPHTHEQHIFAHKLNEILKKGKEDRAYDELVLIAPPQFLGELKQVLSDNVRKAVTKEIHKDLPPPIHPKERHEQLSKYLDLWNYKS